MSSEAKCELCGEPMPKGEEMFKYHGHSGPCPKPPKPTKRYQLTKDEESRLNRDYTYHVPKENQIPRYQELRDGGKQLAKLIMNLCPTSREQSIALTHLETALFYANASIARNE